MQKPFMRIPYTGPLPPPFIIPSSAATVSGAVEALARFLAAPLAGTLQPSEEQTDQTVLLTGAGISVASGLADYRGESGTYRLNRTYRPIYYGEFLRSHLARQRYWARSFLGWTNLYRARPNAAHRAVKALGDLGVAGSVITQSASLHGIERPPANIHIDVDSFHNNAHPALPTIELHGYLRQLVCVHCHTEYPREAFQASLSQLNPAWAAFLAEMLAAGALDTEHPEERRKKGLRTNPDGDVDLPDAPYSTFRYPACPTCLGHPPTLPDGSLGRVETDADGAWAATSTVGVLKPAVIMFGESTRPEVKADAEQAVDAAKNILVVGSSLATYSAWRLVKRAQDRGMPIGVVNMGGIRGEDKFFAAVASEPTESVIRCSLAAETVLPALVEALGGQGADEVKKGRLEGNKASFGRME